MVDSQDQESEFDLTVLIVSYKTKDLTLLCLKSLFSESPSLRLQVIVVDNASDDGSVEEIESQFPQVQLIASRENLGFGRANNLAAKQAKAPWLLLLNPDTQVLNNGIEKMIGFAKTQTGDFLLGGRTFQADGQLDPGSCWGEPTAWSQFCMGTGLSSVFRRSRVFDPESLGSWERDSVREVAIISGCLVMLSRDFWERLGGFDPEFFMYSEDFDLSMRATRMGARCIIVPEATILHHSGASERVRADKMVRLISARIQLYNKHWPRAKAWFGMKMMELWCLSRTYYYFLARIGSKHKAKSYEEWKSVWSRRCEWRQLLKPSSH